jgi:4'-phosphopantetheinyl transferase
MAPDSPAWMTIRESERLAGISGLSRSDFLASRWLIRRALAVASGQDANLCQPFDGRPDRSASPPGWRLSLSHSGGIAGCAISEGPAIGLDIEPLTRKLRWQKLVRRWFSPEEQAWLLTRNDTKHFLKVWTLKEAWLKATGRGIANNLQTLSVGSDFALSGDRPGANWQASLGHVGDCLMAVVYQGPVPPRVHTIVEPINVGDPAAGMADDQAINWVLHQPIHSISEPT